MKSKILVFIQFSIIFFMLLPVGGEIKHTFFGLIFITIGLGIGIAALIKNRIGNFNIRPDIKSDSFLITNGIYSKIRHPMYLSVLTGMFGILILYSNLYELILYIILCVDIFSKMLYEEHLWNCDGNEYKQYCTKTYRLIPYIF